ncbi:pyrroline-5-carboxylate reductase [Acetonema longum]|uniref:Pyrroline-5-carboxylate reductase n=1 Tax=Acetonema longum DSM 6540 TaxID=1009370 RepID=F7NLB6_9FIRM|nr:pyrroline-5-carboxylate reductase [Acetonema longum]EGO63221.1 pyrroline-5-carboxylate reductase [Acetonema longum DSM 6540]
MYRQVGFIGGGAMAEALVNGILSNQLFSPGQITVADVVAERLEYMKSRYQVAVTQDNAALAEASDLIFLAVKPQHIHGVLDGLAGHVRQSSLIVTIVAGINIEVIQNRLPQVPIIRVMPNTPVAVNAGMSALALGPYADETAGKMAADIFNAVGRSFVTDEALLDAVTGLSGSGPGYAFVLIDALADAGVRVGLPRQTAITLAAQTLMGAAKMVLDTGEHPAKLRDMVTSPGGTTIAGIHVLEQKGVRAALVDAVLAATQRSRELGNR